MRYICTYISRWIGSTTTTANSSLFAIITQKKGSPMWHVPAPFHSTPPRKRHPSLLWPFRQCKYEALFPWTPPNKQLSCAEGGGEGAGRAQKNWEKKRGNREEDQLTTKQREGQAKTKQNSRNKTKKKHKDLKQLHTIPLLQCLTKDDGHNFDRLLRNRMAKITLLPTKGSS